MFAASHKRDKTTL